MNRSKLVFGGFFILLGSYILINNMFDIDLGKGIPYLIASIVLAGFYYGMKKSWIGVLSLIMLYVGLIDLSPVIPIIGKYLEGSITFLLPGIFFLVLYISQKKSGHLILGTILLWIGVAKVFEAIPELAEISYEILLICLGFAFITIYLVKLRQWTLVPAVVLIIIGSWDIANYYYDLKMGSINITSIILAVVLIFFGIGLMMEKGNLRQKNDSNEENDSIIDVESREKE